jgi:hypothetical protein
LVPAAPKNQASIKGSTTFCSACHGIRKWAPAPSSPFHGSLTLILAAARAWGASFKAKAILIKFLFRESRFNILVCL